MKDEGEVSGKQKDLRLDAALSQLSIGLNQKERRLDAGDMNIFFTASGRWKKGVANWEFLG